MRKKTIVALMLALSIAQTGSVYTYAKNSDAYISGDEVEFSQEDLSETEYLLGYTIKDGYKYILEYGGSYYASEYHEEDTSEGLNRYCEFTKSYATKEEAVKSAQAVPKDIMLSIDISAFKLKKLSDLSSVKFLIYDGTDLKSDTGFDKLNTIVTDEDTEETGNSGTDSTGGTNGTGVDTETKKDGKVEVSVNSVKVKSGVKSKNKVTVSWKLKDDYAASFEIAECEYNVGLGEKASGKSTAELHLANGTYKYTLCTTLDKIYTGSFTVKNKYVLLSETHKSGNKGVESSGASTDKAPKVTLSKIPKKVYIGYSFDLKVKTDVDAMVTFNGQTSGKYGKNAKFNITRNGDYSYSAITKDGQETTGTISVNCFKNFKYDRNGFWKGNEVKSSGVASTVKRLVQTGMYDTKMLVVAAVLGISGVVTLGYRFYKKRRKGGSNAKNS